ncbi:inositol monophosphatase family protein [Hydrogenimonas sp.]
MTPFVKAVMEAADEIAAILREGWRREFSDHDGIGAGGDETAGIDRLAERIYIEKLSRFGKIDSEECGLVGKGEATIVLDPIDGSSNAISGLPYFGSAVALERDGKVEAAVVVNLANGDFFYKTSGGLMRTKLGEERAGPVVRRESAAIGIFEKAYANPELALALLRQKRKFRSPGAVALSLAYAHYVDFVIFAGPRRRYDFAAALWMCEDLEVVTEEELLVVAKSPETARDLLRLAHEKERA